MEVFERLLEVDFIGVRVFKVGTEQSVGRSLWAENTP